MSSDVMGMRFDETESSVLVLSLVWNGLGVRCSQQ
jgi:hypothetical protein